MQLSLNALQVHTIYAGRNAEAVHKPLQGDGFIKPIEEEDGNLDSPESKFWKVLTELYAKLMIARYSDISKEHCEGCGYNAPSPRHHDCILIRFKDRIEILFDELIIRANEEAINEMALETMCEEANEIKDVISKTFLKKIINGLEEWKT